MKALDLFAGTGWGVACQRLGIEEDGVELMEAAVASREAAGMRTVARDVRDIVTRVTNPAIDVTNYELQIASPPCQTFSMAGKGAGRAALEAVLRGVTAFALTREDPEAWPSYDDLAALTGDERTALVLEPLRVALAGRPRLLVWEQVPTVLPVWEACAEVLRADGYSVVTGVLQAEAYGVPQTRKRAFLIARRDGKEARLPTPTHSRYYSRDPKRLDSGVRPWVSMAEALGWGATERPAMTVTGGGASTGGAEPFGNAARQGLEREREAPGRPGRNAIELRHGRRPEETGRQND